jgi:hypothetical protein
MNTAEVRARTDDELQENQDHWRTAWQWLTSDLVFLLLLIACALGYAAYVWLPQAPFNGTVDAYAYSQWLTRARAIPLYSTLSDFGLFELGKSSLFRAILVAAALVGLLRLIERIADLTRDLRGDSVIRNEMRYRVIDLPVTNERIAQQLAKLRFRFTNAHASTLVATRAPWAALASVAFHIGTALALVGALVNLIFGWSHAFIAINTANSSSNEHVSATLLVANQVTNSAEVSINGLPPQRLERGEWVNSGGGLQVQLVELLPELNISANDSNNKPLPISVSSYGAPSNEAVLSFRVGEAERAIAIEPAKLTLLINANANRVRAYSLPGGQLVADQAIDATVVIQNVKLKFSRAASVILSARYSPGNVIALIGLALALMGWVGTRLRPIQRIVVINHADHWVEFYASGRGVRATVRQIVSALQATTTQ